MGLLMLAVLAIDFLIIVIAMAATAIVSVIGGGILLYAGIKRKEKPPIPVICIVLGAIMIVFSLFLMFFCSLPALAVFTSI